MNQAQQNTVNAVRSGMVDRATNGGRGVAEVKQEKIEVINGIVYLSIEVGRVGDEGTASEIYCRNRRLFMIGKRGGISLLSVQEGLSVHSFDYKQVQGLYNALAYYPAK